MSRIEVLNGPVSLSPTDLVLGKVGTSWVWASNPFEIVLQPEPGLGLEQCVEILWENCRGLLGDGELIFKAVELTPWPKGYVVFVPSEV